MAEETKLLSLDDFLPPRVTVHVTTAYGRELDVPLQLMTWHRWSEIGLEVADPKVPTTKVGTDGAPASNYEDKKYLKDMAEASVLRDLMRLAEALSQGGGVELPGATLRDMALALRDRLDSAVVNTLMGFMRNASLGGKAMPTDGEFRGLPGGGAEGDSETSSDAE